MIPQDVMERHQYEREQLLTAAMVVVDYSEGFPAFENGQPIWSQMPFESEDSFHAFCYYLEAGKEQGVRLVEQIANDLDKSLPLLMDYFHLYYWKVRSKAYDLFITTVHEKKRLQRMMKCEDSHYLLAENLLKDCMAYFKALNWETIDPAVIARMVPALIEVQRKSVGLSQFGENAPTPQSVEVILRQMTKLEGPQDQDQVKSSGLDILLANPDAAAAAQELIIKLGGVTPHGR